MKSVFLCSNLDMINKVYSDLVKIELNTNAGLEIVKVYTIDDITKNENIFCDIECIFSTWNMPQFVEEDIKKYFPRLKAIFYAAGTVKYFAKPFLNLGIRIYSAKEANSIPVAEFVVSQIILANKGYFQSQLKYKRSFFKKGFRAANKISQLKPGNYKSSVGIIGAGSVGRRVILLLKSYDINTFVYDPFLSDKEIDNLKCKRKSLEEIFRTCDVISNHLPDIDSTKGILDYQLFSRMNDNATFINTGRGFQVIEKDLVKVLREKPGVCAILDVTKHEPVFPLHPFKTRKNVFVSPHIAGSQNSEQLRMGELMLEAYKAYSNSIESTHEIKIDDLPNRA
ncbi:MAG: NAD(P)-dependent oxidoreductase [Bacillota bacterium]